MVQDRAMYIQWQTNGKLHMIYRMVPFSMNLNDPNPFCVKGTPLFEVEYLRNSTK